MSRHLILGVSYVDGSPSSVVEACLGAGLVVIPSAPVLVRMSEDPAHREALIQADIAITDSGLMVLLWRLLTGTRLVRVSGLEFLKLLLERPELRQAGATVWIMPSVEARDQNLSWLRAKGHPTTEDDCYLAPQYPAEGALVDTSLLAWVQQRRPRHIIIALGGGVQERLGWFLKQELEKAAQPQLLGTGSGLLGSNPNIEEPITDNLPAYRPCIHCVGAAIGFLSGEQVRIPMWADYFYLGWLVRCLSAPRKFIPRYWRAIRLIGLLLRFRQRAPVLRD